MWPEATLSCSVILYEAYQVNAVSQQGLLHNPVGVTVDQKCNYILEMKYYTNKSKIAIGPLDQLIVRTPRFRYRERLVDNEGRAKQGDENHIPRNINTITKDLSLVCLKRWTAECKQPLRWGTRARHSLVFHNTFTIQVLSMLCWWHCGWWCLKSYSDMPGIHTATHTSFSGECKLLEVCVCVIGWRAHSKEWA